MIARAYNYQNIQENLLDTSGSEAFTILQVGVDVGSAVLSDALLSGVVDLGAMGLVEIKGAAELRVAGISAGTLADALEVLAAGVVRWGAWSALGTTLWWRRHLRWRIRVFASATIFNRYRIRKSFPQLSKQRATFRF